MVLAEAVSGVKDRAILVAAIQVGSVQSVEQAPAQHLEVKMVDLTLLVVP